MVTTLRSVDAVTPESAARKTAQIRVYVVQQQTLMAKALCNVMQQDPAITVVGDGPSVNANQLAQSNASVILLDSESNVEALPNAIGRCRIACPRARIGVLSEHISSEVMQRAFSAGADGYIVKDITPEELIAAVKAMGAGNVYVDPRLVGSIVRGQAQIGRRDPNELSPREADIVRLIAAGLSNREISIRLGLSDKTVKNHISHIFAKLNLRARTQVVVFAIRSGLA